MQNRGCFLTFLAGAFVGVLGAVLLAVASVFLLRDVIVARLQGQLQPPPITTGLEAEYGWEIIDSNGKKKTLEALRGRVAVVHLFSPECNSCLAEWPSIEGLYEKTADLEVAIVSIAIDKTEKLGDFMAQYAPPFPVYAKTDPLPKLFLVNGTPATFIYAKDGSVVFKHVGSAKWDDDSVVNYLKMLSIQKAETLETEKDYP